MTISREDRIADCRAALVRLAEERKALETAQDKAGPLIEAARRRMRLAGARLDCAGIEYETWAGWPGCREIFRGVVAVRRAELVDARSAMDMELFKSRDRERRLEQVAQEMDSWRDRLDRLDAPETEAPS